MFPFLTHSSTNDILQEQRPSGALLLPGCRVEERELEEEEEEVEDRKEEKAKEEKVKQGSCLVVVRPDGSSLLLRAEVFTFFF